MAGCDKIAEMKWAWLSAWLVISLHEMYQCHNATILMSAKIRTQPTPKQVALATDLCTFSLYPECGLDGSTRSLSSRMVDAPQVMHPLLPQQRTVSHNQHPNPCHPTSHCPSVVLLIPDIHLQLFAGEA